MIPSLGLYLSMDAKIIKTQAITIENHSIFYIVSFYLNSSLSKRIDGITIPIPDPKDGPRFNKEIKSGLNLWVLNFYVAKSSWFS